MSFYRNVVWYCRGLNQYTKKGYEKAAKNFKKEDLEARVEGRSFLITGANSGIGKVVAIEVAKRGGTVHMVCRNEERGRAALEEVKSHASGDDLVHLHILDMSQPKEVYKFGKSFADSGKQLHVLVNNAGCMVNERQVDEETKLEANFATNSMGVYLLTESLIPTLKNAQDPRVIVVSSGGMLVQKLDYEDMQFARMKPFDGTMAYAQNKRQQVVMVEEWAKRFPEIHFSSMHPGWADTPAVQSSMPDFHAKMKDKLRSPEEGADTAVWLAVVPKVPLRSGCFAQDRVAVDTHLPMAWTKSSAGDVSKFMSAMENLAKQFME